jgi:hypothetical protein
MSRRKQKLGKIDSPLYKFWQALYLSFYSNKLYVDVVKRWQGLGGKYLAFCLLIICIPLAIKNIISMDNQINNGLLEPINLIPKFTVIDGEVKFSQKMPYFIKNHEGNVVVIIDTTGVVNKIKKEYPELLLLINKNKIYFRFPKLLFLKNDLKNADFYNHQDIDIQDLSGIAKAEFRGDYFIKESGLKKLKNFFLAIVYPVIVFGTFGMLMTVILAFAMMGQIFSSSIFHYKIGYKQSSRLAVIATSIGVGIYLNLKAFDIYSSKISFLCVVIALMYYSYGVLSVKRDSKHLVYY